MKELLLIFDVCLCEYLGVEVKRYNFDVYAIMTIGVNGMDTCFLFRLPEKIHSCLDNMSLNILTTYKMARIPNI